MFSTLCSALFRNALTLPLGSRFIASSRWKSPNEIQNYPWKANFRINRTRCYFPRPNETKRIKKHGWEHRLSTEGGRKVLMNRMLKGRHVLSH